MFLHHDKLRTWRFECEKPSEEKSRESSKIEDGLNRGQQDRAFFRPFYGDTSTVWEVDVGHVRASLSKFFEGGIRQTLAVRQFQSMQREERSAIELIPSSENLYFEDTKPPRKGNPPPILQWHGQRGLGTKRCPTPIARMTVRFAICSSSTWEQAVPICTSDVSVSLWQLYSTNFLMPEHLVTNSQIETSVTFMHFDK